jgi:hypothetical protein
MRHPPAAVGGRLAVPRVLRSGRLAQAPRGKNRRVRLVGPSGAGPRPDAIRPSSGPASATNCLQAGVPVEVSLTTLTSAKRRGIIYIGNIIEVDRLTLFLTS